MHHAMPCHAMRCDAMPCDAMKIRSEQKAMDKLRSDGVRLARIDRWIGAFIIIIIII